MSRAHGRCLGAEGSQPFSGCEGCEVTKGNHVMAACLKPVGNENYYNDYFDFKWVIKGEIDK